MTLVRWEPTREGSALQNEFNRLFGSLFESPATLVAGTPRHQWIPAMDLVENADEYVLHADLPGLDRDAVKIEFDENVLTISGERKTRNETEHGGYRRVERASGSFSRSLTLPKGTDPQRITAAFGDGVLEVHIPRAEQPKPHRVEIQPAAAPTVEAEASEPVADEALAAA